MLSIEPKYVYTTGQAVTVKFRIEKVSRRKDGKRFKICFDVDYENSSEYQDYDIKAVMTEPVVVLSKRKNSVNSTGSQPKSLSKKRLKAKKNEEKANAKDAKGIAQIQTSIKNLEKKLSKLHERVVQLESENKTLRSRLSEDFALESLSEYQAVASLAEPVEVRKTRSSPFRRNKVDESSWDDGLHTISFDDEESISLKPIPVRTKSSKYTASAELTLLISRSLLCIDEPMNFDFGIPSASFGPRNYIAD